MYCTVIYRFTIYRATMIPKEENEEECEGNGQTDSISKYTTGECILTNVFYMCIYSHNLFVCLFTHLLIHLGIPFFIF